MLHQPPSPTKILVTGTLRAGKTTLLTELSQRHDVIIVREVAQDLIDQYGYEITQVLEFQDMVFSEQLRREKEAMNSGTEFVICDRGTVDIVAFSSIIGHPIKPEWEAALFNRYQAIVICDKDDIAFDTTEYSVNFDMVSYRAAVDDKIREVMSRVEVPILEARGTLVQRVELMQELLAQWSIKEGANLATPEGWRTGKER